MRAVPGVARCARRNVVPLGYDPAEIDAILLTHAHLDHCGLIPHVVNLGYRGPIYATHGTVELAALVLLDSGKLQEELTKRSMRWERRHPEQATAEDEQQLLDYRAAVALAAAGEALVDSPALEHPGTMATAEHVPTVIEPANHDEPPPEPDLDAPLYTEQDARAALLQFKPVHYDAELEVAPGIHARWLDAGHILGSAIIVMRVEGAAGEPDLTVVFSGDLGRPGSPILRDYTTLTAADYVLIETTYGGREHQPQQEAARVLAETVRLVADADGVLLVPVLRHRPDAGLIYELDRLIDEVRSRRCRSTSTCPWHRRRPTSTGHVEYFDEEAARRERSGQTPFDYPRQVITNNVRASQAIAAAPRPYMIIASNGMLTGGRVVGHLRILLVDPAATLLFVGYQGEGTLGASLQAGARRVKVEGQVVDVRCQIRSISGFSAHADEPQLLAWLEGFTRGDARPRRVFLVHGDPDAQVAIEPKIQALGLETHRPQWHERVPLD